MAISSSSRGPLARGFSALRRAFAVARSIVVNLAVLAVLMLIGVSLVCAAFYWPKSLQDRTTLVIEPKGELVERSADPTSLAVQRALRLTPETVRLRDLLLALDAARSDPRIERVLLRLGGVQLKGMASSREIADAVGRLKASGKQVVVFSEALDQKQYLIASNASEIFLDPQGWFVIEGLNRYRIYYREALQDKLGVDVHLMRAGKYKSAGEVYLFDAASAEAKEADRYWLMDLWQRYLDDVAKARKLDPVALGTQLAELPESLAGAQGNLAERARQMRLIDALKTRAEVDALITQRGVADADVKDGFRQISLTDYVRQLEREMPTKREQVAVVVAEGEIRRGEQSGGVVGEESTSGVLRSLREDKDVRAVVLRVNSRGGESLASEKIRREVVALKRAGKPVVVSMGDYAASGGYLISADADRIYADASTITGSIGVFAMVPNFARALDRIGVHSDGVGTSRLFGSDEELVARPWQVDTEKLFQASVDGNYRDFVQTVAEGRGITPEQVDAVAQGRVWSGAQAKDRGLVDALGGISDAVAFAAQRAKLQDFRVRYVDAEPGFSERLLSGALAAQVSSAWLRQADAGQRLLGKTSPRAAADFEFLERAMSSDGVPVRALMHCLCEL